MKKIILVFILCVILLYTGGCNVQTAGNIQKIAPPNSDVTPIQGKWNIDKVIGVGADANNTKDLSSDKWVNKNSEFSSKFVIVGGYILYNPNYKIRRLDLQEYLLFNHKSLGDYINLPSKETDIITITGKDRFFCEIIKINDNKIILEIDKYNLYLSKISDKIDNILPSKLNFSFKEEFNSNNEGGIKRTGVLIGMRAPIYKISKNKDVNIIGYNYRTLLVNAKNKRLHPIIECKNIIFPRKSGFWKMEVNRSIQNGKVNETINSYNITTGETYKNNNSNSLGNSKLAKGFNLATNKINYIGNDFISIENNTKYKNQNLSKLKIVPIDSLPGLKGIKLSDVVSDERIKTVNTQVQNIYTLLKKNGDEILVENSLEDNLGLLRNAGHWYFYRHIDFQKNNLISNEDFRLNIIPPANLIFYDELCVSWTDIKERVPDAVDVYTSPNKDLAIILTKYNRLIIYGVNSGILDKIPLKILVLKNNEKIIMAEWATGSYSENWEKFITNLKSSNPPNIKKKVVDSTK
jgi:hypothetical protein